MIYSNIQDNQARLFNEIVQFNAAANQKGGGSGLGLYVSQSLVKLNGGIIGVSSAGLGHGSQFYVEFPLFEAVYSDSPVGVGPRHLSKEFCLIDFRFSSTDDFEPASERKDSRLLIVDDSTLSRKMVAQLLRPHFSDVVEASDGMDALKKYSSAFDLGSPFHVVLMDWEMPKVDDDY